MSNNSLDSRTPILVAAGQFVDRSNSEDGLNPIQLIGESVEKAQTDSGSQVLLQELDVVACSGLTVDARQVKTPVSGLIRNVPLAVAKECGLKAERYLYAESGGNTPQQLVNHFAKEIAQGKCQTVLLAGGEALHTMQLRFNSLLKVFRPKGQWRDKNGPEPEHYGDPKDGNSAYEGRYWMNLPANVYPMFENALRAQHGRSVSEHQQHISSLFARFSEVAASNPYAWFTSPPSKAEILGADPSNRMVGFPYRKKLNSMILVNQSAALIMTSVAKARALGIPSERWVYLHGYADGYDVWNVSERDNFYRSPAIQQLSARALAMAGKSIDDIAAFDLYSCFPSAVQIALNELGIAHDDTRPLTLTGGLPYFGGPGNNYSMHAIAEMINWARENPNEYGFLNANGWYLTKHAMGVYSQQPLREDFKVEGPTHQTSVDAPVLNPDLQGEASIETYTVLHGRDGRASKAIIVARGVDGERCLATTDNKPATLERLITQEGVGVSGELRKNWRRTVFEF